MLQALRCIISPHTGKENVLINVWKPLDIAFQQIYFLTDLVLREILYGWVVLLCAGAG